MRKRRKEAKIPKFAGPTLVEGVTLASRVKGDKRSSVAVQETPEEEVERHQRLQETACCWHWRVAHACHRLLR